MSSRNESLNNALPWRANVSALYLARAAGTPIVSVNEAHLAEGRGLEGPYYITINVLEREEPNTLVLQAGRNGRIGGKINTVTRITFSPETVGSLLTYETTTDLEGPVAAANNPLFQKMAKHSLKTFFKNLDTFLLRE